VGLYATGASVTINAGTRNGYNFYRWSATADVTQATSTIATFIMPASNVIATAEWLPIQYSISYLLNDGSANNLPWSYTVEYSFPIVIPNPTRTGYEFLGWTVAYADGTQLSSQVSYRIPVGTTGNVVLTANWRILDSGNQGGDNGGGGGGGSSSKPSPSASVPGTPEPTASFPSTPEPIIIGDPPPALPTATVVLVVVILVLVGVVGVLLHKKTVKVSSGSVT